MTTEPETIGQALNSGYRLTLKPLNVEMRLRLDHDNRVATITCIPANESYFRRVMHTLAVVSGLCSVVAVIAAFTDEDIAMCVFLTGAVGLGAIASAIFRGVYMDLLEKGP